MFRWVTDLQWKIWYPMLTRRTRGSSVMFLNYGYDPDPGERRPLLQAQDEPDRSCIQLYHRVAGAVEMKGREVLEISCGHGGGAAYVTRYLKPRLLRAVDRNGRAIALCQRRPPIDGLNFSCGNALALNFPAAAFDVVINVEASHCYPDMPRFLSEVRRVLRPGGHFLFADFRDAGAPRALLQRQLKESGLEMVRCDDISANVVRGMQLNTEKYMELIRRLIPRPLQKSAIGFAGVKGSGIYKALESGDCIYLCCDLRKPAGKVAGD